MIFNAFGIIINIILVALLFLPFTLVVIDTFFRALFLIVATVRLIKPGKAKNVDPVKEELSLFILVVANNEERIIGQTLRSILEAIKDAKFVTLALLADNCTDQTAQIAADLNIKTYIRADGDPGKGKALSWLSVEYRNKLTEYDLIAILDADTLLSNDFYQNLQSAFYISEAWVVQSFVEPVGENGLPLVTLASFSEILSQKIDDEARSRLGWTSPLRGTGMIFRRDVFFQVCTGLTTKVDDIEMSLRLADLKINVSHNPYLRVFDPKSSNILGLAKQRGRWLKGQRDVWQNWRQKYKLPFRISWCPLLHALLIKPKTALLIVKIALSGIFFYSSFNLFQFFFFLIFGCLCIDILYYGIGLLHVNEPKKYLIALLSAPMFCVMWIISWFFSFSKRDIWLRVRE
jgi:cellulose synthase/poly-beta-1,6-N-acetylglucosamine synthase-like glycosyltransferase